MSDYDLHAGADRLQRLCTVLTLGLLAILILEIAARAGAFSDFAHPHHLGLELLFAAPALLQLAAIWSVRNGLSEVASGALFTPSLSRMLRRIGFLLSLASAFTLVLAPYVHHLAGEVFPRALQFDVANLVLGGLGVILIFLGRLFDRAVRMQRELDEMF